MWRIFSHALVKTRQQVPSPKIAHLWRLLTVHNLFVWQTINVRCVNQFVNVKHNQSQTCSMYHCSRGHRWDNPQSSISVFGFWIGNTLGRLGLTQVGPRPLARKDADNLNPAQLKSNNYQAQVSNPRENVQNSRGLTLYNVVLGPTCRFISWPQCWWVEPGPWWRGCRW